MIFFRAFPILLLLPAVASSADVSRQTEVHATYARARELFNQGLYREAELSYRRALAIFDKQGPAPLRGRAIARQNLASVLRVMGRYSEAEALLSKSVAELEQTAGADSLDFARALQDSASLYQASGRLPQAENRVRRAIGI